jgi:hypothetical protein
MSFVTYKVEILGLEEATLLIQVPCFLDDFEMNGILGMSDKVTDSLVSQLLTLLGHSIEEIMGGPA